MADIGLSEEALAVYAELEGDTGRWPTLDVVEDVLVAIAEDPGSRSNRARRFQDPACFAVPVATDEGDWIVLWREVTDPTEFEDLAVGDVFVIYIGPLFGGH